MTVSYEFPLYTRRQPRTNWKGGMITQTDLLTLEQAASFASKHAETEVSAHDFLRAAARGEILLRAIVHRGARLRKYDGGIYCNKGTPTENMVPEGAIPTLPVSACRQLANTGRASWRTIDGYEEIDGVTMRFEIASLLDEEPDFETTCSDCRVIGYDVHALADAFIDEEDEPESLSSIRSEENRSNSPTAPDWKSEAVETANKIGLERWQRGEREITARNICEAVATELGKHGRNHGKRGARNANTVRSEALKGWKFKPPTVA